MSVIPERVVYPIYQSTDYTREEVYNLTNEQLEAIDWKQVANRRGVGPMTRKILYQWLVERRVSCAKDVIQIDLFDQQPSPKDDTKLRLRILELKVEYDKAMQDGSKLDLVECYKFIIDGTK